MDLVSYEERHNEANGEGGQGRLHGLQFQLELRRGRPQPEKEDPVNVLRLQQMKNAFLLLLFSGSRNAHDSGRETSLGTASGATTTPTASDNPDCPGWSGTDLKKQAELFGIL